MAVITLNMGTSHAHVLGKAKLYNQGKQSGQCHDI